MLGKVFGTLVVAACAVTAGVLYYNHSTTYRSQRVQSDTYYMREIISSDTANDFHKALVEDTFSNVVVNSRGGNIVSALKIAEDIHSFNLPVTVEAHGQCDSACVYLYLASPKPVNKAVLCIHAPSDQGVPYRKMQGNMKIEVDKLMDRVKILVKFWGYDPALVDEMLHIHNEDYRCLSQFHLNVYKSR